MPIRYLYTIGKTHGTILIASLIVGFCIPQWHVLAQQPTDFPVPDYSGRDRTEHPILAPCSRFDTRYAGLQFAEKPMEEWPELYHDTVNDVVEEYLKPATVSCDADDYEGLQRAEKDSNLYKLATNLPTWADKNVPLGRLDTPRVLLEYLRIYECALTEFDEFLMHDTWLEEYDEQGDAGFLQFFLSDLMRSAFGRAEIINQERAVARTSLNRTLTIMGAFDRLAPLDAELECMQRFSLDMRNITALSAEASACLPRIWNAKDTLRDIKE